VPQQFGQDLQIGSEYPVEILPDGSYAVNQGNEEPFSVISADKNPDNFRITTNPDVYAVEDTIAGKQNTSTTFFNGQVGQYRDPDTGNLISTIDINDARLGNEILVPETVIPGQNPRLKVEGGTTVYGFGKIGFGIGAVEKNTTTTTQTFLNTDTKTDVFMDTTTISGVTETTQSGTITETTVNTINATEATLLSANGSLSTEIRDPNVVSSVSTSASDLGAPVSVNKGEVSSTDSALIDSSIKSQRMLIDEIVTQKREIELAVVGSLTVGAGVQFTLSGTPGTEAANTLSMEAFVMGDTQGTASVGGAVEVVLNPFGSKEKLAYDVVNGKAVPMYQTQPVLNPDGSQVFVEKNGQSIALNEFKLDQNGNRIPLKIETGEANGPQFFMRADVTNDFNGKTDERAFAGVRIKL
jgi:hypothetical protein